MTFINTAKARFSCRKYKPEMVEDEKLIQLVEAVHVAPSAVNYQPGHFIIVRDSGQKAKVYEAYQREWLKTAPVIIIACGDHLVSWKRSDGKDHLDIDISIAVDHLTMQATELGLATCWVCNFNAGILKQNFNLPGNIEPIVIIPLGYPVDKTDPDRHGQMRKPVKEIVHWETF
jgi:nitroreductase